MRQYVGDSQETASSVVKELAFQILHERLGVPECIGQSKRRLWTGYNGGGVPREWGLQ